MRDRDRKIEPHAEQAKPGEELHPGELLHRRGHFREGGEDLARAADKPRFLRLHSFKRCQVSGGIFLGGEHGPEDRRQNRHRADVKGVFDGDRNGGPVPRHG